MRRLNHKNGKIGLILVLYSMIISIIVIFGMLVFLGQFKQQNFAFIPEKVVDIENIESTKNYTVENIYKNYSTISRDQISNYYNSSLYRNLPFLFIIVCGFISIITLLLWILLRKIERAETIRIAKGLRSIENKEDIDVEEKLIQEVYLGIKEKFNMHIEDYKRLNSYISHEQKNAIAILKAKLEKKGEEDLIKTLDQVSNGIEDILTLSDSNDSEEMEIVDIVFVCAEACDEYKKIYKDIYFDFDEDANTYIYAKERWIYRAIANLLDNAIKYGDGNKIEVNVKCEKASVIICVRDYGIGMKSDQLNNIFENRYRIDNLNKDGYGIGLSLIKHVCSLSSGYVWVESEINVGSRFYLVFPEYDKR